MTPEEEIKYYEEMIKEYEAKKEGCELFISMYKENLEALKK
jgi:hypothetical protein